MNLHLAILCCVLGSNFAHLQVKPEEIKIGSKMDKAGAGAAAEKIEEGATPSVAGTSAAEAAIRDGADVDQAAEAAAAAAGSEVIETSGSAMKAASEAAKAAVAAGGTVRDASKSAGAIATAAVMDGGGSPKQAKAAAMAAVKSVGGTAKEALTAGFAAYRAVAAATMQKKESQASAEERVIEGDEQGTSTAGDSPTAAGEEAALAVREDGGSQDEAADAAGAAASASVVSHQGNVATAAIEATRAAAATGGSIAVIIKAAASGAAVATLQTGGDGDVAGIAAANAIKQNGGSIEDQVNAAGYAAKSLALQQGDSPQQATAVAAHAIKKVLSNSSQAGRKSITTITSKAKIRLPPHATFSAAVRLALARGVAAVAKIPVHDISVDVSRSPSTALTKTDPSFFAVFVQVRLQGDTLLVENAAAGCISVMSTDSFASAVQSHILTKSGFEFRELTFAKPITKVRQADEDDGHVDQRKEEAVLFLGVTAVVVMCFNAVKSIFSATSEYQQITENEIVDGKTSPEPQ